MTGCLPVQWEPSVENSRTRVLTRPLGLPRRETHLIADNAYSRPRSTVKVCG